MAGLGRITDNGKHFAGTGFIAHWNQLLEQVAGAQCFDFHGGFVRLNFKDCLTTLDEVAQGNQPTNNLDG
ncbi:MAG TPA: hypothetical protein VGP68_08615 [Gemmataceae bacterium]|nr:hypothetical protein [Gemmataceae bacterium]